MVTHGSGPPPLPHGRESGGFKDYGRRLIFLEHTRGDETYNRDRLQVIADTMNGRTDRGIWCPIVVGHTNKYDKSELPVVGYFGQFEVADNAGPEGEAGIYARQYISNRYPNAAEDYPRLSVEIWTRENILDPVSLLGGSTPYFDLPLLSSMNYERPAGESMSYEVSTASGGNAMIPMLLEDESERYVHGDDNVNQMLQALWPMLQKKIDEHLLDRMNVPDQGDGDATAGDATAEPNKDIVPAGDESQDSELSGLDEPPAAGTADMETENIKTSTGPDSMDESKEFRQEYMRNKISKTAKLSDGVDQLLAYSKTLDEEDLGALNAVLAEKAPEGLQDFYEKASKEMKPESEEDEDEGEEDEKEKYRRERDDLSTKYRRSQDDLDEQKRKYTRLEGENSDLRKENAELKDKATYERRRSDLTSLAKTYALNIEKELENAKDMSEPQWERHTDLIRTNYQRVPDGGGIGGLGVPPASTDEDEKRKKYHKAARDHCEEILRRTNKGVDYNTVYEKVRDTDGKVTLDELMPK